MASKRLRALPFRKARPVRIGEKRAMKELRRFNPQRAIEQDLPGCGAKQISATHHFRNFHRRVIDHHGKLVRWNPIVAPDEEIAEVLPGFESLLPNAEVVKRNDLTIGYLKSPIHSLPLLGTRHRRNEMSAIWAAGARIDRFIVAGMRSLGCEPQVLASTLARIHSALGAELLQRLSIVFGALTLKIRSVRSAHIGAFLPSKTEPPQILHHRSDKLGFAPVVIDVFHAQQQCAPRGARALLRRPECSGVA